MPAMPFEIPVPKVKGDPTSGDPAGAPSEPGAPSSGHEPMEIGADAGDQGTNLLPSGSMTSIPPSIAAPTSLIPLATATPFMTASGTPSIPLSSPTAISIISPVHSSAVAPTVSATPTAAPASTSHGLTQPQLIGAIVAPIVVVIGGLLTFVFCVVLPRRKRRRDPEAYHETKDLTPERPPYYTPLEHVEPAKQQHTRAMPSSEHTRAPPPQAAPTFVDHGFDFGLPVVSSVAAFDSGIDKPLPTPDPSAGPHQPFPYASNRSSAHHAQPSDANLARYHYHDDNDGVVSPFADPVSPIEPHEDHSDAVSDLTATTKRKSGRDRDRDDVSFVSDVSAFEARRVSGANGGL